MKYSVYIVECADGTYYAGIATDVERRLQEHNGAKKGPKSARGKGARYTSARRPVCLVYEVQCASRSAALKEEHRIKQLTRRQKKLLIAAAHGGRLPEREPPPASRNPRESKASHAPEKTKAARPARRRRDP